MTGNFFKMGTLANDEKFQTSEAGANRRIKNLEDLYGKFSHGEGYYKLWKKDVSEAEFWDREYFEEENDLNTVDDYFVQNVGCRKVDKTIVTKPIMREISY